MTHIPAVITEALDLELGPQAASCSHLRRSQEPQRWVPSSSWQSCCKDLWFCTIPSSRHISHILKVFQTFSVLDTEVKYLF